MNDPFSALRLYAGFEAGVISAAFAEAVRRGVPVAEARAAMDILRDPVRREAAALLAPSMSPAAALKRASGPEPDVDPEAMDTILRFLAQALVEIDAELVTQAVVPPRRLDVDGVLPPLPAYLEP
ncbi:MAG TPA: hypothetical protein VLM76_00720 [Patescibacteria group bacterium]|nr:hypothetical protein [Patescibacteria group bacterium]